MSHVDNGMKEIFTLRRFYFRVGLICALAFLTWLAISVLFMLGADDFFQPDEKAAGIILATLALLVPGSFLAMSIWVLLAYYRESITLENGVVHLSGVLFTRTLLSDGTRAFWRWGPHPSLKLYSPTGNATIWFENFRGDQQKQLIYYFREWISLGVQDGWNEEFERPAAELRSLEQVGRRLYQYPRKCLSTTA